MLVCMTCDSSVYVLAPLLNTNSATTEYDYGPSHEWPEETPEQERAKERYISREPTKPRGASASSSYRTPPLRSQPLGEVETGKGGGRSERRRGQDGGVGGGGKRARPGWERDWWRHRSGCGRRRNERVQAGGPPARRPRQRRWCGCGWVWGPPIGRPRQGRWCGCGAHWQLGMGLPIRYPHQRRWCQG